MIMNPTRKTSAPRLLGQTAALVVLLAVSIPATQAQSTGALLEVTVPQVRNAQGGLGCQLFASAQGFPKKGERALQSVMSPITNGTARCRFQPVPAGTYAVAVVHDKTATRSSTATFWACPPKATACPTTRPMRCPNPGGTSRASNSLKANRAS